MGWNLSDRSRGYALNAHQFEQGMLFRPRQIPNDPTDQQEPKMCM